LRVLVYGMAGNILGGIETFLLNMNEHMSWECIFDYIIDGKTCIHEDRIHARGGEIYYVAPKKPHMIRNIREIYQTLKKKRGETDLLYINVFSMCYVAPILLGRILGYRVAVHAHNSALANQNPAYQLMHRINRFLLRGMKFKRLTNSSASADFMFGKNSGAELIYNAIDCERYRFNEKKRQSIRQEYGLGERPIIGFVGRISYEKNILFLIKMFKELLGILPDAMLMIVGDGDKLPEAQAAVENLCIGESVRFTGMCDNVADMYSAMDVFVLPSRFEGLGIVLVEAQASGLPCITSADVVPQEAKVCELIHYVPLSQSTEIWARTIFFEYTNNKFERIYGYDSIVPSNYNILHEAIHLEKYLDK